MDKFEIMFQYWSEAPENYGPNRDIFLYYCKPSNDELMRNSLIELFKVQKGMKPCPWRKS